MAMRPGGFAVLGTALSQALSDGRRWSGRGWCTAAAVCGLCARLWAPSPCGRAPPGDVFAAFLRGWLVGRLLVAVRRRCPAAVCGPCARLWAPGPGGRAPPGEVFAAFSRGRLDGWLVCELVVVLADRAGVRLFVEIVCGVDWRRTVAVGINVFGLRGSVSSELVGRSAVVLAAWPRA